MKSTKTLVRVIAVVMMLVLSAGILGCANSYNTNPIVAKVGGVKLDFNRFYTLYTNTDSSTNPYYSYMQYGAITREQYADYIIDQLVAYGVQLDQVNIQNITLDSEEEAKLQQDVEDYIKESAISNYSSEIDSAITDEAKKAEACMEKLYEALANNNRKYDDYRKDIENSLRESALIEKLRKVNIGEVTVTNDDLKAYVEEKSTVPDVANFMSAWQSFVARNTEAAPLVMPHPEKGVEDDPETTDKDETVEADPNNAFFTVQHLLMKFSTEASGDDANDLPAYAEKDQNLIAKMTSFESGIAELTTEQFLEKCHDKEMCDDPGMLHPAYQYFGYIMQTELISQYYEGFGIAAMKLKYGHDWEEPEKNDATTTAEDAEKKPVEIEYFTLADGAEVAKVYTKAGIHYIIVNPNDCFSMYDDDGYLMFPLYDGDELVTDSEGIVTVKGHMTQEQLDAMNAIYANVQVDDTSDDESAENAKDIDVDTEEEEVEPVTAKSIYDYFSATKKSLVESDIYTEKFNAWKENTKVTVYRNIIKPFIKG